jgi:penicillin-binding protein 1A
MIRFLAGLFSFAVTAGVAGLAGVALVVWFYDRDLPDHASLARYEPATLSRVYSAQGDLIAEFARERRIFTPIDEIPQLVKNAFIAAEDKNFHTHAGVDPVGIVRAALSNVDAIASGGGQIQGASTITQQVMKNFLLTSDRSLERKIKEIILAVRFEQALSKDRILELYLNEIFLGQNAYGVTAAAQRYFGKPLESLTLAEAAYLAALPKAPSDLHPVRQRERSVERRNYVLRQMRENGMIDEAAFEAARAEPLATLLDGSVEPEVAAPSRPNHFTEEVRRQLVATVGPDMATDGGLTVRATIDPDLQEAAAAALRAKLEDFDRARGGWRGPVARIEGVSAADEADWRARLAAAAAPRDVPGWRLAVVLEVGERSARVGVEGVTADAPQLIPFADVREWARPRVGPDRRGPAPRTPADVFAVGDVVHVRAADEADRWSLRQIPEVQGAFMAMDVETGRVLALQGGFSHDASAFNRATQAQRQPGSSFKPFVYAAALDVGYTPATIILDAPVVVQSGGQTWKPQNSSGRFYGPAPMRLGLELSRNLMTIRLAQEIGMERVADYAERFGVYDDMPPLLSFSLGAGETTLSKMVAAYGIFANGGRRIAPTLIDRIQDRRGATIWRHDAQLCLGCDADPAGQPAAVSIGEQIMDPVTAYQIVSMLQGVTTRGTAARSFAGMRAPVAGKTGTTNEAKDVWFVGVSPRIAAGCYIGHDEPRSLGDEAFGGTLCAPVVAAFFRAAFERGDGGAFEPPPGVVTHLVDRATGRPSDGPDAIAEVFRVGYVPGSDVTIGGGAITLGAGEDFPMSLDAGPVREDDAPRTAEGAAAPRRPPASAFAAPGGLY